MIKHVFYCIFLPGPGTDIAVGHLRRAGFRIEAVWGKTSQEASGCANRLNVPFATANAGLAMSANFFCLLFSKLMMSLNQAAAGDMICCFKEQGKLGSSSLRGSFIYPPCKSMLNGNEEKVNEIALVIRPVPLQTTSSSKRTWT